ncbi:MAG: PQQ-binding-like beta-propeller repeat protein [Planctomycetota bacterium]
MDSNQSQQASSSSPEAPSPETGGRKRKWRVVAGVYVWVVTALACAVIAVVRGTDVMPSRANANIATWIAAFVAIVTLLLWFAFFSRYTRRVRMCPLVGSLAVVGVFALLFRIDGTSGDLWPEFALRFSPKPDELLGKPKLPDPTARQTPLVDLVTTTGDDFPQFLGPDRSASIDHLTLARNWNDSPPEFVWRQEIGAGWSGFAVVGGHAVTMEQRGELEMVTCYDVNTGQLQWLHSILVRYQTKLAGVGPRATPTIDEGMVYTLGATGRLLCLDGATGQPVWEKDLRSEYGVTEADEEAEVPYGRANSPLVVDDLLIIPAGGPQRRGWVSLAAYDKRTGEPVWQGGDYQISYSSPVLATLDGRQQILIVNQDYVTGHDVATGVVLWEHQWPGRSATNANVSQAVPLPPDRVFLSKGYSHGAALLRLVPKADGTFDTQQLWHSARVMRTKFTNVVLWEGHVYGLSDGILECIELDRGARVWKSGRYGHGQLLRVGELLLVLSEKGRISLVEATPQRRNNVLGEFQALEGKTWNTFALYGPHLLVRNGREAACYKLPLEGP